MKTKAEATHVFELRLWSRRHYIERSKSKYKKPNKALENIYNGLLSDVKGKKKVWIHSPSELLTHLEKMYATLEKKERKK